MNGKNGKSGKNESNSHEIHCIHSLQHHRGHQYFIRRNACNPPAMFAHRLIQARCMFLAYYANMLRCIFDNPMKKLNEEQKTQQQQQRLLIHSFPKLNSSMKQFADK